MKKLLRKPKTYIITFILLCTIWCLYCVWHNYKYPTYHVDLTFYEEECSISDKKQYERYKTKLVREEMNRWRTQFRKEHPDKSPFIEYLKEEYNPKDWFNAFISCFPNKQSVFLCAFFSIFICSAIIYTLISNSKRNKKIQKE